MSLAFTRSCDAAFTYEQMRAVARCSMHDNTVAVAISQSDRCDWWPGESRDLVTWDALDCGHVAPVVDGRYVDGLWVCPSCWITERRP